MAIELKCPVCWWCNQPMVLQDDIFVCANTDCSACAELFLHKALMQAKQDLEILKQALEKYADEDMWETGHQWDVEYIQGLFLERGYKIAKEALEQINRKQD